MCDACREVFPSYLNHANVPEHNSVDRARIRDREAVLAMEHEPGPSEAMQRANAAIPSNMPPNCDECGGRVVREHDEVFCERCGLVQGFWNE
jgi:hypothetical protein